MPKKINSAFRIHKIISSTTNQQPNSPTLGVWATAFDIKESSGTKIGLKVAQRLGSLLNELNLMKIQLLKYGFEEEIYNTEIQHIELAIDPVYFNSTWNSVTQYLTPTTIKSIQIFSQSLPNEETEISSDEINELFVRLSELESFLENSTLPERLILLIISQISLIRDALYEYPIAGEKALREAIRYAKGEYPEVEDLINENISKQEIQKLGEIWSKVDGLSKKAVQVKDVFETIEKGWDFISGFLPPPS
jgi:hypothetical protein